MVDKKQSLTNQANVNLAINRASSYLYIQFFYVLAIQVIFTGATALLEYKGMMFDEALDIMSRLGVSFNLAIACLGIFSNRGKDSQQGNLIAGIGLLGAGIIVLASSNEIVSIYIGAVLISLGCGLSKPVIPILYGKYIEDSMSTKLYKKLYAMANLGALLGPFIFGLLEARHYKMGYIFLGLVSFLFFFKLRTIKHNMNFFRRYYAYIFSLIIILSLYLSGYTLYSFIFISILVAISFRKIHLIHRVREIDKPALFNVFIIFALIDQKYFLLQEIFVKDLGKPFSVPLLYAFSAFMVVATIALQNHTKRANHIYLPAIAYGFCAVGYICLFIGMISKTILMPCLFLTLGLFSICEVIYIPVTLGKLSKKSKDKVISVSFFFLCIALARQSASFINTYFDSMKIIYASSILCFLISIGNIIIKKCRGE